MSAKPTVTLPPFNRKRGFSFAPIEDSYFADWDHPDPRIQETYSDLVAWSKAAVHLWAWLYPNPWGTGAVMPVGNVERVTTNTRLMQRAGVTGVFTDHNGFLERAGWSEWQSYLPYKLMQDVNCDTDAVINEFTDHHYGAASSAGRLEAAVGEETVRRGWEGEARRNREGDRGRPVCQCRHSFRHGVHVRED